MKITEQIIVATNTPANLANIASLVAKYPPFSQYGFADMLVTLQTQLQRQTNVTLVRNDKVIAYGGWLLTRQEVIDKWLENKGDPVSDWNKPEAALVNIVVSDDRKALKKLTQAISSQCDGLPIYRKRTFQGARADHKRPPLMGRKRSTSSNHIDTFKGESENNANALMTQLQSSAQKDLSVLVQKIYLHASRNAQPSLPLLLVDEPEVIDVIARDHQNFEKNYQFLEDFSEGRFSNNGDAWTLRRPLTQSQYISANGLKHPESIYNTYLQHLQKAPIHDGLQLFNVFLAAATEVVLGAFGIDDAAGWKPQEANKILKLLQIRQWISWHPEQANYLEPVKAQLSSALKQVKDTFTALPQGQKFLSEMTEKTAGCPHFDAGDELVQNLLAATETTASSLAWVVEILSKNPSWQDQLRSGELSSKVFAQEILRLYTPVPFVTRVTKEARNIKGVKFKAGQSFILSILGAHTHPDYWKDPMKFDPKRVEFVENTYHKKAYIPFLTGGRACGGQRLAQVELEQGLQVLLDHFDMSQPQGLTPINYVTTSRPVFSSDLVIKSRV